MDKKVFVEEVIRGALRESAYRLSLDIFSDRENISETEYASTSSSVCAWYKHLSTEDQEMIKTVVRNSIDCTLWRFLFVFGDQSIGRIRAEHGMLELYYRAADGTKVMLSGDREELEEMHNIYYSSEPDCPDWISIGLSPFS
jgi:hypothetical protein